MSKAEYRVTMKRDVGRSMPTDDRRGVKYVKTGEEVVTCLLTVDMAAVGALLGWKIRRGQNKTTLADGAIRLTVVDVQKVTDPFGPNSASDPPFTTEQIIAAYEQAPIYDPKGGAA